MAENPAAQVYSAQLPGLATVLGSGLTPLRIYQQENATRARAALAAAKAKQAEDASMAHDLVSMAANGAAPYQDELLGQQHGAMNQQVDLYRQAAAGVITPYEAKARSLALQDGVKASADRTTELAAALKDKAALGSDTRYNKVALADHLHKVFYNTDPGTGDLSLRPSRDVQQSEIDAIGSDPATFNAEQVKTKFLADLKDKENIRIARAAPLGGYGTNNQASSDIFDVHGAAVKTNADGSPVIKNIGALLQRAHDDPFMSALLHKNIADAHALASTSTEQQAGVGAMARYQPLDDAQAAALGGVARLPPATETLARMIGDYGRYKQAAQTTYRAPQKPSTAAANASQQQVPAAQEGPLISPAQVDVPGEAAVGVSAGMGPSSGTGYGYGIAPQMGQGTVTQQSFHSYYHMAPPVYGKKGGQPKSYGLPAEGVSFPEYYEADENGKLTRYTNSESATTGAMTTMQALPSRPDGSLILPANQAEYNAAMRDPANTPKAVLQVMVPKNKYSPTDVRNRVAELTREQDTRKATDFMRKGHYKSPSELEDQARDDAAKGYTVRYVPYTGQNVPLIDQMSKGGYRSFLPGMAAHVQRLRAAAPAPNAAPSPAQSTAPRPAPSGTPLRKSKVNWN